jgi:hypothetical protein
MKTYRLELSEQHFNVIAQALLQVPWGVANPVIVEIERQVNAHSKPPAGGSNGKEKTDAGEQAHP